MSIFDTLISSIAPHTCLGCGYEGAIICVQCFGGLKKSTPRCYKCQRFSVDSLTCANCRLASCLSQVRAPVAYDGLVKQLVWRLKFDGAQGAAGAMANFIQPLLAPEKNALLVPVPTASTRARIRSYDQAKLLAKALSRRNRLPYEDCLYRGGQTHQVGSSRQQRLRQLDGAFLIKKQAYVRGKTIILVDDVVTTGATLEAAAAVLHQAGAREIRALVFAQA